MLFRSEKIFIKYQGEVGEMAQGKRAKEDAIIRAKQEGKLTTAQALKALKIIANGK